MEWEINILVFGDDTILTDGMLQKLGKELGRNCDD